MVHLEGFIAKITDETHHSMVIDKDVWEKLGLKKGDYVKIPIEKIKI